MKVWDAEQAEQPGLFVDQYIDQPFVNSDVPYAQGGRAAAVQGPFAQQIICGDCCGDGAWPVVTAATEDGRCNVCGGRAYVSAEKFGRQVFEFHRIERMERTELKVIVEHAIQKGLIRIDGDSRDYSRYRNWLRQRYGVNTVAALSSDQRMDAMNALRVI
ncbi:MAG TPA: hypothetical protein VJX67_21425 [Blastocatellia bacterium]|nr:hypothetical protein [Blastocatellia bacterium]